MSERDIYKLQINDLVKVRCNDGIEGFFIAQVITIDGWKRRLGVVDSNDQYKLYPFRRILSKFPV